MNAKTANFPWAPDGSGRRHDQFFCALSGAHVCTTQPVLADTSDRVRELDWSAEGKQHFNHCRKCGAPLVYRGEVE